MIAYFLLFALVFAAEETSESGDIECKADKFAQLTKDENSCECMTGFTKKSGEGESLECECKSPKEVADAEDNGKKIKKGKKNFHAVFKNFPCRFQQNNLKIATKRHARFAVPFCRYF